MLPINKIAIFTTSLLLMNCSGESQKLVEAAPVETELSLEQRKPDLPINDRIRNAKARQNPKIKTMLSDVASVELDSTQRLEQMIGNRDKETGLPTPGQSFKRFKVLGTDLGWTCNHDGINWFFFGDTIGPGGGDTIGYTFDKEYNSETGMPLEFPLRKKTTPEEDDMYYILAPKGILTGGFNVPSGCFSANGKLYFLFKTNTDIIEGSPTKGQYDSKLYEFRYDVNNGKVVPKKKDIRFVRDWEVAGGPLGKVSFIKADGNKLGIHNGEVLLAIASGKQYRKSDIFFGWIPTDEIETGNIRYFSGFKTDKAEKALDTFSTLDSENLRKIRLYNDPQFAKARERATPIVNDPIVGDLSIDFVPELNLYILIYDSRPIDGVGIRGTVLRWSHNPWGPYSEPQLLFSREKGFGKWIHQKNTDDGLEKPVFGIYGDGISKEEGDALARARSGGNYAPYMIRPFKKFDPVQNTLQIYYLSSTWNPYVVQLMTSVLKIDRFPSRSTNPLFEVDLLAERGLISDDDRTQIKTDLLKALNGEPVEGLKSYQELGYLCKEEKELVSIQLNQVPFDAVKCTTGNWEYSKKQ